MKTKSFLFVFIALVISNLVFSQSNFENQLTAIKEIKSIEKISNNSFFQESYVIFIKQYLDHNSPKKGTFLQRVIISHKDTLLPIVFITEGYKANYATRSSYINELCKITKANQIVVEHRYFGESFPDSLDYKYLTIENAVADLHRIHEIFEKVYPQNKWLATGISKGGSNTMSYSAYYPGEMDAYVPYVGPINFKIEDKRMERFLKKISTKDNRKTIIQFQMEVLKNREKIQPLLDSLIEAENYSFYISNNKVLDYTVLEYSFAFWQWGYNINEIPSNSATPQQLFDHLIKVSNPNYFAIEKIESIKSFFIQSVKEFGYYGYQTRPFKKYLVIDNAKNYNPAIFLGNKYQFDYSNKVCRFISKQVRHTSDHMILIYGELDPWTGGAVKPKSGSAHVFVKKGGSHLTRINNLPEEQRQKVISLLESWIQ